MTQRNELQVRNRGASRNQTGSLQENRTVELIVIALVLKRKSQHLSVVLIKQMFEGYRGAASWEAVLISLNPGGLKM